VALRRYGLVAGVTLFVSCGLYAELARVASPGSSSFRLLQYLFGTEPMSSEVVVALCFFSIYKFFATLLSVTLPLPVGLFTPTFVIGGLFGRILGTFAVALFWIS
jgi:H+/Cl- antiporter ClcA